MLFTSLLFIIFFLVVLLGLCIIQKKEYQHILLLIASYYFYWVTGHLLISLLIIATLIAYYCGDNIFRSTDLRRRKIVLAGAVIVLLGILGYFKYYNFGISAINTAYFLLFNTNNPLLYLDILLPIGISFYTFHALSYLFDIYRNKLTPAESFREFALYMAFFPQLVAGPIVRAVEFLPQLKKKVVITPENLRFGLTLMAWGFFKKVAIADNLAPIVNGIFAQPVGSPSIVIMYGTFLFGIQIFCDFSGYTDIASIMGFHLPINFDSPYLTRNPTEFWRKWHITLSRFVRDYLYIPLGGNRKGTVRTHINLIVTWLACGLWHGAAWNFIAWGGYHGILLSLHKVMTSFQKDKEKPKLSPSITRILCLISVLFTQYLVFVGWLIFRVNNLEHLMYCLKKVIIFDFILTPVQYMAVMGVLTLILALFLLALHPRALNNLWNALTFDHIDYLNQIRMRTWILFMMGIFIMIVILGPDASPQFLYFRF
jgi:alginate O-acetyltransferase complex protein AlgI